MDHPIYHKDGRHKAQYDSLPADLEVETQLGFEKTNREDAQKVARELRKRVRELKDELKDVITEYEEVRNSNIVLRIAYHENQQDRELWGRLVDWATIVDRVCVEATL